MKPEDYQMSIEAMARALANSIQHHQWDKLVESAKQRYRERAASIFQLYDAELTKMRQQR